MKHVLLATFLSAMAVCGQAGEGQSLTPLRDPWVPPAARATAPVPETRGETLRAQVEHKLHAGFAAADVEHKGSITREQARAARLAVVDENFEAIDRARAGRVTFEDYKRFLRARGARTL
ncbi:MAG TPA: EF-hand domain-containing protein [Ramlibacter sp.]|nr:EF-hand domain-containing protein [Ramlibacter sp.]